MIQDLLSHFNITPKKVTAREWASACPSCGGQDRFRIYVKEDRYWCRGCGTKGDAIQFRRDFLNQGFKEAAQAEGKDSFSGRYAGKQPEQGTQVHNQIHTKEKQVSRPEKHQSEQWQQKAYTLVQWAQEQLKRSTQVLTWLEKERGITEATALLYGLGYLPRDIYRPRKDWGLGEGKDLWIPGGLVIPYVVDEKVIRVRIRRFNGEPRYVLLPGSLSVPAIYTGHEWHEVIVIVESDLDALLLWQATGVSAIALGSAQIRPDEKTHQIIEDTPLVLNALDSDHAGGKEYWHYWKKHYPKVERLPPIDGKDVSEMLKNGILLPEWLKVGMQLAGHASKAIEKEPPLKQITETTKDNQRRIIFALARHHDDGQADDLTPAKIIQYIRDLNESDNYSITLATDANDLTLTGDADPVERWHKTVEKNQQGIFLLLEKQPHKI